MYIITMENEEGEHDIWHFKEYTNAIKFFNDKIEEREKYWYMVNRDTNYADIDSTIIRISEVKTED